MCFTCRVSTCHERPTDECFECGQWHCDAHLLSVQMPTASGAFAERLCSTCLASHVAAPDRYGCVRVAGMDCVNPPEERHEPIAPLAEAQ
jgi:hypothetical protein